VNFQQTLITDWGDLLPSCNFIFSFYLSILKKITFNIYRMSEEWREIKGYTNYFISNLGNLKKTNASGKTKLYKHKKHYTLEYKHHGTHYLVAEHFCEKPNSSYIYVEFIDGNRLNFNAKNLNWKQRPQFKNCKLCNFKCLFKNDFNRHLKTKNHLKREYEKETYDCVEGETILFMN